MKQHNDMLPLRPMLTVRFLMGSESGLNPGYTRSPRDYRRLDSLARLEHAAYDLYGTPGRQQSKAGDSVMNYADAGADGVQTHQG
jgi:hypothetical protein